MEGNVFQWFLIGLFAGFGWAIGTAVGGWVVAFLQSLGK